MQVSEAGFSTSGRMGRPPSGSGRLTHSQHGAAPPSRPGPPLHSPPITEKWLNPPPLVDATAVLGNADTTFAVYSKQSLWNSRDQVRLCWHRRRSVCMRREA